MRFPANPGSGPLAAVVCGRLPLLAAGLGRGSAPLLAGGVCWWRCWVGPCHSWLRVSGAGPRHSWLGSAGRGGGCFRGWGFPVLCVLVARSVRVVLVVVRVVCVPGVCFGGGVGVGVPFTCVCVCVCACVVCWRCVLWCGVVCWWERGRCVLWLVPCHSWRRFLCATPRHSWLGFAASGGGRSSPLLAEGPGSGFRPLLAGVRRRWWCAAPRHSWLGPAGCGGVLRGWGCPLLCVFVVVVGPLPLLSVGPGCGAPPPLAGACSRVPWLVARHSWPRTVGVVSLPLLAGVHWLWWWGPWVPFSLVLVCVCVCCVALRVGVGGAGGVVRGVAGVCVCVCACGVWLVGCVIPWLVVVVGRHVQKRKKKSKEEAL